METAERDYLDGIALICDWYPDNLTNMCRHLAHLGQR